MTVQKSKVVTVEMLTQPGDPSLAFLRLTRIRVVSRPAPAEPGKAVSCKYWSKVDYAEYTVICRYYKEPDWPANAPSQTSHSSMQWLIR